MDADMSRWFRLYDTVLDDPKVQRLPDHIFKTWINLLCLASKGEGFLPSISDMAFSLRLDEMEMRNRLTFLIDHGLIDGHEQRPHNWDGRQFKSDRDISALDRQRRKRERDKEQSVTRDVTDMSRPPDTDTDTEKIYTRRVAPVRDDPEGFEEFWSAYPKRDGSADRKGAVKAFRAASKRVSVENIIEGATIFSEAMQDRGKVGTEFIPQARTWLNGDRWNDRYETATTEEARKREQYFAVLKKHGINTGP